MKVKILKTDERLRIKAGEVYEAQTYRFDPDKVTLLSRVPDGYCPECNQYKDSVSFMLKGRWHIVNDDGEFIPEEKIN